MKTLIGVIALFVSFVICSLVIAVMTDYHYGVQINQHLKLADDASTAEVKLEHLNNYVDAVKLNVKRNDARYIFKQKQYTRDTQLEILDTLIIRLEDLTAMNPQSFEYQTGMGQITGQEFDNVLSRVNSIFWDCYRRETVWRWICTFPTVI